MLAALFALFLLAPVQASLESVRSAKPLYEFGVFGGSAFLPDYPAADEGRLRSLAAPQMRYRGFTENYLCENLLFGEWKNRTRVVVTHRLGAMARFDKILFLEDGRHFKGTYDELMQSCVPFHLGFLLE